VTRPGARALADWRAVARGIARREFGFLPSGIEVWRGPSAITGDPIVVVATGIARATDNAKTGDLIQFWILPQDQAPNEATKSGLDRAVCGSCKHRACNDNACYVVTFRGPRAVWQAWQAGRYPELGNSRLLDGAGLRFGAWGDPGAVPLPTWLQLAQRARNWAGYTHLWRSLQHPSWRRLLMASVDTDREHNQARALGWRCFRIVGPQGIAPELLAVSARCPAEQGVPRPISCAACGQCNGSRPGDRRPDKAIAVHGARAGRFLGG